MTGILQSFAAASVPAKVAVATVASVGVVSAGVPVVATVADAQADDRTVVEAADGGGIDLPGLPVIVTTSAPDGEDGAAVPVATTSAPVATVVETTTTTSEVPPIAIELGCARTEADVVSVDDPQPVVCEWANEPTDRIGHYVLVRDGERIGAVDATGEPMRWLDEAAPKWRPDYQVKGVNGEGEVIATSRVVTVAAAAPVDGDEGDGDEGDDEKSDHDDDGSDEEKAEPEDQTDGPERGHGTKGDDEGDGDEEDSDDKYSDENNSDENDGEEKDDHRWEYLSLWCERSHEGGSAVVCEFSLSDIDDFGHYVVKRDGQVIWRFDQRSMPGRPWPDIRFVDEAAPTGRVEYSAYVVDADGDWAGGSSTVSVAAVGPDSTTPPTTGPSTTTPLATTEPPPTTTEPEVVWESLAIGCERQPGGAVVCEFSQSGADEFALYILKRDGVGILEWNVRTDTSFTDHHAPAEATSYSVYVMNSDGDWIGGSHWVSVPAA